MMNEQKAIQMLDRIRDEDCGVWTQEAWDSFDMAISALKNQKMAKKVRKMFLSFICAFSFFAGLISLACAEGGNRNSIVFGIIFLTICAIAGSAYNDAGK